MISADRGAASEPTLAQPPISVDAPIADQVRAYRHQLVLGFTAIGGALGGLVATWIVNAFTSKWSRTNEGQNKQAADGASAASVQE